MLLSIADTNGVSTKEAIRMLDVFWVIELLIGCQKIAKATVILYKLL
jgi:hypothetical protein